MKKILTILLTIYDPKEYELENYFYSFNEINERYSKVENPFQFMIVSDNPNLSLEKEELLTTFEKKIDNLKYYPAKENLVRVGAALKWKDEISGKFVKLADPDDFLIPDQTISYVEEHLMKIDEKSLVINSYKTTGEKITIDNFKTLKYKIFYWPNSFNPNSVYSASILKSIKWDFKLLIWSDDLLGFLMLMNGAKISKAKNHAFYINQKHAGVSTTKDTHTSMRFYEDTILFFEKAFKASGNSFKSRFSFKRITSKPNFWLFKQCFNDLELNSSLTKEQKIEHLNNIYNVAKKVWKPNLQIRVFMKKSKKMFT